MNRRSFLQSGTAAAVLAALPSRSFAQHLPFEPKRVKNALAASPSRSAA